eukprot:TRINITY_DN14045_c0_g1_i1.p1 TRINITY_DN14045_c0_g1~~TRINITY_DN14045_c0_g1_i1.p1  ORF type:complete len:687 (-),score=191.03 TRINITY_DN14045_c0_g1_i1:9-2069(-)
MVMASSQDPGIDKSEEQEFLRKQLLVQIAGHDNMDETDLAKHEEFLKARQEAFSGMASKKDADAQEPLIASGRTSQTSQQVRIGGQAFGEETARKLESIAKQASAQEEVQRLQFLKAKEAGERTVEAQANAKSALEAAAVQLHKEPKNATGHAPSWISDEEYKELGYPQMDPKFRDPAWHKKQLELDSTDPRHNPNLNRDANDPEFWYHAARRPFHKALLRTEQHWNGRRKVWLSQFDQVKDMNQKRELIADLLEECPNDVKRLVTPIMHFSITMTILSNFLDKARQLNTSFEDVLLDEESLSTLRGIRQKIDAGGPKAAEEMLMEYGARVGILNEELEDDLRPQERRVADVHTLAEVMNWGQKCKKDGLIEWERGNWAEAHASWRQADETLQLFKAAEKESNQLLFDLHGAVLKNLAQACMKLGYWCDAVKAADTATQLCPEDHKAWFRKACALEGLGRLEEVEECLQKIEECSVGRPDRMRIAKDTQAKREKLQALREREQTSLRRTFEKALDKNIFSEDRAGVRATTTVLEHVAGGEQMKREMPGRLHDESRKQLTRDGAEDLLLALRDAYRDSTFQLQVLKLAQDVRGEKRAFLTHLKRVALPLQKPVLEQFGFEPSEQGLKEMTRALQDHTRGPKVDAAVKRAADEATIALYGIMYDKLTRPDDFEDSGPQLEVKLGRDRT